MKDTVDKDVLVYYLSCELKSACIKANGTDSDEVREYFNSRADVFSEILVRAVSGHLGRLKLGEKI